MRQANRYCSANTKISVKQTNPLNSQHQYYQSVNNGYQIDQRRYPPNHIQSQSSVSLDPSYREHISPLKNTRERRRKIFDKKVFKAIVIPYEEQQKIKQMRRNYSQSHQKYDQNFKNNTNPYKYNNSNDVYQNYYTLKNIDQQHENINTKPSKQDHKSKFINSNSSQFETVRNYRQTDNYNEQPQYLTNQDSVQQIQRNHSIKLQQQSMLSKNKQKTTVIETSPSFAKNQTYNSNEGINNNKNKQQSILLKQQINQLCYQMRRIKQQVIQQREQISHINDKVIKSNKQNYRKQKELLQNLINKQNQLVLKQQQLNNSYDKIIQIQTQSGQRYEQILKNQLQLQRAKRIQNISMQNQKLYQQLLKNQTKQSTIDVTPLSHPVNINYFRDQHNLRQISALQSPYRIDNDDYQNQYDNTLRDLLSPLEIKPDQGYYY